MLLNHQKFCNIIEFISRKLNKQYDIMKLILTFFLTVLFFNKISGQFINEVFYNEKKMEVLILPSNYKYDSHLIYIGKVRSPDPAFTKNADFKSQLDKLSYKALQKGSNIIVITKLENRKLGERYKLKGKCYNCEDIEEFKKRIFEKKSIKEYQEIVLYRPNHTHSLNDLYNFTVIVNGKEYLMKRNTKYFLQIDKKNEISVQIKRSKVKYTIKAGSKNPIYLRCLAYFPKSNLISRPNSIMIPLGRYIPKVDLMDIKGIGQLESSLIKSH